MNSTSLESERIWNQFIDNHLSRVCDFKLNSPPARSDCTIAIIEPRSHPHLEFVLRNALYFLGGDWSVTWFHGGENAKFARSLSRQIGPMKLIDLGVSNLNTRDYNQLKKSPFIWENLDSEHILWLEPDCLLCRQGIEDYLHYDYVGAPWSESFWVAPNCRIGNGGLSLRRRTAMLEISRQCNASHKIAVSEDVFYVMNMSMRNHREPGYYKFPEYEKARSFSVESVWHPRPLGLHKTWKYLGGHDLEKLLNNICEGWENGQADAD